MIASKAELHGVQQIISVEVIG